MIAVLTCHFLFALRQADRTATTPSSLSEIPSLNFASAASCFGPSSHGSLPAFIASIGSEVNTGLHFVDGVSTHLDRVPGSDETTSYEGDSAQEDEDEVCVANMSREQRENV